MWVHCFQSCRLRIPQKNVNSSSTCRKTSVIDLNFFTIFFFNSKFVIEGHGFEFEKLSHRLKHAIIMSLFLFHVCTKAGMVTKNEHFPLLVFTGYERTKHCRNKYSLIFFTALPVVLLCPKLVYQRSVGIFKKRERLFL